VGVRRLIREADAGASVIDIEDRTMRALSPGSARCDWYIRGATTRQVGATYGLNRGGGNR